MTSQGVSQINSHLEILKDKILMHAISYITILDVDIKSDFEHLSEDPIKFFNLYITTNSLEDVELEKLKEAAAKLEGKDYEINVMIPTLLIQGAGIGIENISKVCIYITYRGN